MNYFEDTFVYLILRTRKLYIQFITFRVFKIFQTDLLFLSFLILEYLYGYKLIFCYNFILFLNTFIY